MKTSEISSVLKTFMRFPSVRFSLAGLVVFVLINGLFLYAGYVTQHQQAQRAQGIASSIDQQILNAQSVLQNVARASAGMQSHDRQKLFDVTLQTTPYFSNLAELPPDQSEPANDPDELALGEKPDQGQIFKSPFLGLEPATGEVSVYLAQPSGGGSVILGKLSPSVLQSAVNPEKLNSIHELVYLTDDKGLILARSGIGLGVPAALPILAGKTGEKNYNTASIVIQNTQPSSQATVPLTRANWYVVSISPLQALVLPYLMTSFGMLLALAMVWVRADLGKRQGARALQTAGQPDHLLIPSPIIQKTN